MRAAVLALSLSGCALTALATKPRSFPDDAGTVYAAGIGARGEIVRDAWGIPHVRAASDADAVWLLGFAHARDRLFQADGSRRVAFGRLSEWLGRRTVDLDVFMRTLDLRTRARARYDAAPPETRAAIDAYVSGFNAGAASLPALPVEYRVLGVGFEPWTAEDCLALNFLFSWTLSENSGAELLALSLRDRLDRDQLDALLRTDGRGAPVPAWWDAMRGWDIAPYDPPFLAFEAVFGADGDPSASNNWVVGPERSADGAPIVANDPHLRQQVPSLWYPVELRGDTLHVAGVTLPGAPGVIIGHNGRVAWGFTNVMADVVDLAVVERDGATGYRLAGERRELRPMTVRVALRGGREVVAERWWTDVGPLITERSGTHLVALRWHALELEDETATAFLALNRAGSVEDALAAVDRPMVVAQNMVVADVAGDWAWQILGALVDRRGYDGRVPYPASDPAYGWRGWLPRPGERRPERGYVATANQRPDVPDADAISTRFLSPARRDRVVERLEAVPKATVADMTAIQLDRLDLHAARLLPTLLDGVSPSPGDAATCAALLRGWDFVADADSAGAAAWYVFERELMTVALADELGEAGLRRYLAGVPEGSSVLDGRLDRFLPDRAAGVDVALARTCAFLRDRQGEDPARWTWGALHPLRLEHPFGAQIGLLSGWNLRDVPYGGSGTTIDQGGFSFAPGDEMPATWIASMRLVVPLSDPSRAVFVHPGGQSGMPGHPHYRDLFEVYLRGGTVPLWFSDADVAANAAQRLVVAPPP